MPVNPFIPLQGRPGPFETPAEVRTRLANLARLEEQGRINEQQGRINEQNIQLGQMRLTEQEQTIDRARRVREVLANAESAEKALPEIMKIDPVAADAISKHVTDRRRAQIEEQAKQAELATKRVNFLGDSFARIFEEKDKAKWPAIYRVQRALAINSGMFPPEAIPEEMPDETTLRGFASQTALYKMEEERRKTEEAARKSEEEKRAKELHEATLPGKVADRETGLTKKEASEVNRQDAIRKETERHNKAMEAIQRGAGERADTRLEQADAKRTALETRLEEAEARGIQRKIDSLESDKRRLHGERVRLGELLKAIPKTQSKVGGKTRETRMAEAQSALQKATTEIDVLQKEQQALIERKDAIYDRVRAKRETADPVAEAAPTGSVSIRLSDGSTATFPSREAANSFLEALRQQQSR